MTPSTKVKAAGLKNLSQMSEMQGFKPNGHPVVSAQTLDNWFHNKPLLFDNLLTGCVNTINNKGSQK